MRKKNVGNAAHREERVVAEKSGVYKGKVIGMEESDWKKTSNCSSKEACEKQER